MIKTLLQKGMMAFLMLMLTSVLTLTAQQNTNLINAQLASEREKYGLTASDISDYLITDQYTDRETGNTYAYIQQRHNKIIVFNAISVFLIKDNKVLYFKPGMIDNLDRKVKTTTPNITPEAAIGYALMNIGRNEIAPVKLIGTDNSLNTLTYESPALSASPIKVQLVYRAMDDGIYLAWDVSIELKNEPHWWNVRIDALTGNYIDKNDWTLSCSFNDPSHNCASHEVEPSLASALAPLPPPPPLGEYNVYPFPIEAPSFGSRSNLINPEDLTSSPFGWHDDNGIAGNEYTITRGNNVHAYEDANNDNLPGYSPSSATLQFNYPVDLTQAPLVNQDASITNLFYLNNRIHDVLRHAGFTEVAGNFQENNYGNGGLGSDYVQAEAFDGAGTNNANFGTPNDGSNPRMQMFLWTAPTPDRDGSFDNGIVAHEYGHGVSNRLTGGPGNSSCLGNAEQGGEGWSDWLALVMTIEPGDTVAGGMLTQSRGIGTYALNQATNGLGIRRFRYSVNMAINPQTYADLATSGSGPHNKGEIWCDAIWDMTCFLVNDFGYNPDPTVATAGNNIAMRLVLEGMKLQPCSPGYLDARDAILTADALLYGNAHRCRIWEAFARRGMGFSAIQGSSASSTDQTAAFNLPPVCLVATQPPVAAFTSNVSTIPCAGTVQFTDASVQAFSSAWDFGDGGTSILTNPTHQYTSPGTYNVKLVVTNPLGSDSVVHPIAVTSTFSANVTASPNPVACGSPVQLNAVGSGSSNATYALTSIPFAPVTGTPIAGPAGDDIVSSFIPIGFNFPFYNAVQTQLKISTNGFISFNSNSGAGCCAGGFLPNNSSTLSNLIAVCWTDLFVGAPNSVDYFNLTAPNRFVIRWNAVAHCCATTPAQVTAQIILYETGEIEIHNTSILSSADPITQGIENATGTSATVVPGRNGVSFSASNDAYRFTPAVNYSYNWQPGNLNGATQTVNPVANTTYTVNVGDGSGCVEPFTTPLVTVTPLTIVIGGSSTFCAGGSTTLDAGSFTTYNWSTGATTQTITVNTAGTFTVSVTNAGGCSGSGSITTSISTGLTPVITGNLSICSGSSNIIDAGVGYASYSWSTGATTQTIAVSTIGTFTVSVSDGAGCTGTASATTLVNSISAPPINGTTVFCLGSSSLLSTGLYAVYNWSTGATTQSISVNTAETFTVTVTDANGCTASTSVTTSFFAQPAPVITGTTGICPGSSTILDAGVFNSYAWSTGATTQTITVNSALIFTVTVTDANGCTASTSATITIFALPNPVITGSASICDGATNILDAGIFAGYNWSTGSTLQTTSITLPGTYTVTVTDANGCTNSATKTVVSLLSVTPVITLNPNSPVCQGSSVTLTLDSSVTFTQLSPITVPNTLVNATPYPAPLVVSGFPVTGVTVKSVTLNGVSHTFPDDLDILLQSPTGTNVILMSDVGGNPDLVNQNFTFKDGFPSLSDVGPITSGTYAPTNITSPDTWSAPGPGVFTQAAPALSLFTGDMNGTWNLLIADDLAQDGGTINSWSITFEASNTNITYAWSPATGLSNTTQLITTATPATTTTYTVTINDGISGCTTSLSATVNINPAPTPSISGALAFCAGSSTTLDAGVFASYLWSTSETTQTISVNTAGTFTVTVTDGNGCTGSASVTTIVNALPTPSISGALAFCTGSSTTLDAGVFASYLWSTSETTQTISVNTAGTVTVTVTDGNGCTASASVTTIVNALPTPSINGALAFCIGSSTTLNAGVFASYLWSTSETTQTISVNTAGTFTVTVTDGNGCTASASVTTIVNALPTPSISGALAFCAGSSTTLDAGVFASYLWSTSETTQTISVNTAGTFAVTVTDGNGCTGSTSVTTIENPLPTPSITGALAFCAGSSTTLDAGVFASYLWSTSETTQNISVNTVGTFAVTVTDGNGCTGSASVTTIVNPLPTPSISGALAFCTGSSTTLDAGTFASYLWSTSETTQTVSVNTAGTVIVTVTDGNGCTGSASVTTIVNALPTPSISGALAFCTGSSTTLDAGVFASYLWSTSETTQTISLNTAGTFTVTVTDGNGCTGSATVTTTVGGALTVTITGSLSFCSGSSTTLDAGSYSSYNWSSGETTQTISVNIAGTFAVTVTDGNGCTGSASVTTIVNALPTPSISGALAFCAGSSTTLDAGVFASYLWSTSETTQTISVNTAGTFTVTVTDGNGCTGSASVTTIVNALPTPSIIGALAFCTGSSTTLDAGTFASYLWSTSETTQTISVNTAGTVTVTVTDGNGCTGSASVTTIVNPLSTPSISGALAFCTGSSTTLDAGVFASYLWSTSETTQTISVNTAGTVTVTVTDGNGCTGSASVTTIENPLPTPSISGALAFCAGSSTTLDAGLFASYLWSTSETTQTISVNTAGTVTVTVTDGNGCTGSASVTTIENPLPTPSISGALAFCAGSSTTLDAGLFASYLWSTSETTQTISVNTAGTFTVTVTDGNGCTGSATVTTTVGGALSATITGSLSFCSGSSTTLDAGSYSSYNWSSGETTQTISVNTAGTFTVTVTDGNGCTGSASATTTVNASPTPSISGNLSLCTGSSSILDAGAAYNSYNWSTGASTQTISVNTAGTVTVTVTDANGCTGSAAVNVIVNPLPIVTILGPSTFCVTGSANLFATVGYSGYNWSNGATSQSITTNIAGTYTVTVTDANGCTASAIKTLSISNAVPPQPGVIAGPGAVCLNGSAAFSIAAVAGASGYTWSAGPGATVTLGQGTTNVTISFNGFATPSSVSVTANNACGSGVARTKSYVVSSVIPAQPSTINGPQNGLCNMTNVAYNCPAVANATSYLWAVPAGVTILTGQGSNAITVKFTGTFTTSGTISVIAQSGCGNSAPRTRTVNAKPQSPVISGLNWACKGQAGLLYSVAAVTGATSYTWTPVAGSTIVSGQGTTSIVYNWGGINGVIYCKANSGCGSSLPASKPVSFTCKEDGSLFEISDLNLYPNPASTSATLQFEGFADGKAQLSVYDLIGQQLLNKNLDVITGLNQYVLDLSTLPKGIYNVQVNYGGLTRNTKLVVQ